MALSRTRLVALTASVAAAGIAGGGLRYGARELLHRQAEAARRLIGKPLGEQAPNADRTYKKKYGDRLDLLLLGDSIAAGLGALMLIQRRAAERRQVVVLRNASEEIRFLLVLTKLDDLFQLESAYA